jgi:hypothetical protein
MPGIIPWPSIIGIGASMPYQSFNQPRICSISAVWLVMID